MDSSAAGNNIQAMPGANSAEGTAPASSVAHMNDLVAAERQARSDRLEADSRGHDSVFAL